MTVTRAARPAVMALAAILLATSGPATPVVALVRPAAPAHRAATAAEADPPVVTAPVAILRAGSQTGSKTVPFTVSWSATDASGIGGYGVQQRMDGGDWQTVSLPSPTATSVTVSLLPPHEYAFRVRADDTLGNRSGFATGATFRVRAFSERSASVVRAGTWALTTSDSLLGGAARRSASRGAYVTFTFTGSQVSWIATRASSRGRATVTVDAGTPVTVDLYRSTTSYRRQVFVRTWPTSGPHTVVIEVQGTSGRPYVDIDAFVIVDPPAVDPVLVGAGDISYCPRTQDNRTGDLLDGIAGHVFTAGDNVYPDGTATQFLDCFGPAWGRHKRRMSPAIGNHEYHMTGAVPYFGYFGSHAGEPGKGWYAYDLGTWRVYSLNSNCLEVACGEGSEQLDWLKADLASNPRACVAAVWHHPRFSSGKHGDDDIVAPLWQALEDAGAELVVTGHDHDYERFAAQTVDGVASPTGLVEYVVGTGGAPLAAFGRAPSATSVVRNNSTYGVLKLTLRAGSWSWSFVGLAGSMFKDAGSLPCH